MVDLVISAGAEKTTDIGGRASAPSPPALDPIAVSGADAAKLFGVSVRHWRRMDEAEQVPAACRLGQSKRWGVAELRDWVAAGCPARAKWRNMNFRGPRRV